MNDAVIESSAVIVEPEETVAKDQVPEVREAESPRAEKAMALVKRHALWSAGAGILPLPLIDMAALVGVQLRMLSKLAEIYDVPFKESRVKGVVTTLLGAVISTSVGASLGSLVKVVPIVGTLAMIAAVPGMYSAATYAVGRVFMTHFEAGGTFLDFDAQKMRAYFIAEYEKAKAKAEESKTD